MAAKPSPIAAADDEGPGLAKAAPDPSPLPPDALPPVLTADELAALLRVNRKTVYAAYKAGGIPGGRRIGGAIRFSRDAVLTWLADARGVQPLRGTR